MPASVSLNRPIGHLAALGSQPVANAGLNEAVAVRRVSMLSLFPKRREFREALSDVRVSKPIRVATHQRQLRRGAQSTPKREDAPESHR